MKLYKAFLSGLALVACLTASAQEEKPGDKVVYDFDPYWYFQAQVGGQYTLGETSFGQLLSPNAQLGFGRQFTSVFGLRLSANAWMSKGGWNWDGKDGYQHTSEWKWNYVAPQLDFTFNLSNLVCGFNPKRVFNLSFLLGGGVNIGWHNDEAQLVNSQLIAGTGIPANSNTGYEGYNGQNLQYLWDGTKVRGFGHAALAGDFRLSDRVDLGLELGANVTTDHYNSKKAGNPDWYFNGLVGIKVKLGKSGYNKRVIPAPVPQEKVVERVVEKVVEPERPAPVVEKKVEELRRDIFFTINKSTIDASERGKVEEVVNFLKNNPDAKVSVTGYADAGTGNAKINERIAKLRAQSVANELQTKYGIAASRITVDSKGDTVQPFADNDRNRVVIAVAK